MKTINAYTDGSAVVSGINKGRGGFGTFFPDFYGKPRAFSLGFKKTKTGRMEVMALYHAITAFPTNHKEQVDLWVYSDSEYVVKCFPPEDRLKRWIAAGWRNTSGEVKNKDLWQRIVHEYNCRQTFLNLNLKHIRSHQVEKEKNPVAQAYLLLDPHVRGNMVADALADYKRHETLLKSDMI